MASRAQSEQQKKPTTTNNDDDDDDDDDNNNNNNNNNKTKCRSGGHNKRDCRGKKEGKGGVAPAIGAFHTGS